MKTASDGDTEEPETTLPSDSVTGIGAIIESPDDCVCTPGRGFSCDTDSAAGALVMTLPPAEVMAGNGRLVPL